MGLFDSLKRRFNAEMEKIALEDVKNLEQMIYNYKRCHDDDIKNRMRTRINNAIRYLVNTAADGGPKSYECMRQLEHIKRRYGSFLEGEGIRTS